MITLLESSIITFPPHKFAAHMLTYTFQCHDVIFSAKIKETILSRCFVTSLPLGEIWYPWWVNCTYEKWNVETKIPERFLIFGFHFFRFVLFCFVFSLRKPFYYTHSMSIALINNIRRNFIRHILFPLSPWQPKRT